jgi:hypothetical protein
MNAAREVPSRPAGPAGAWWARYRVFLFLFLGLAALDAAVAAHANLWRAYDPDDYGARIDNARAHPCDLLLVGGSVVSEGIDPAVLAGLVRHGQPLPRVYHLGLPGATVAEVWHGARHGVTAPPRLLVYGITASDVNDKRGEPHGPRTLMDVRDVVRWCRERPTSATWCLRYYAEERAARLWQLYYHANAIRLWAADRAETLWPGACPQAAAEAREGLRLGAALRRADGFAPQPGLQQVHLDERKATNNIGLRAHALENYRLGEYLGYLQRLLDWAAARGVEVVLVDMPVSADLEEVLHPQEFARFRAALAEVAQSRRVRVLHASRQAVGLGDSDFSDLIHLNTAGGARLSAWLRRALADVAYRPGEGS